MSSKTEPEDFNSDVEDMTGIDPDDVSRLHSNCPVQPRVPSPDLTGCGEYACSVCGETCVSLTQLARHIQFHDHDRPFPCTICGKRFLTRSHHVEHQRVHTGERPFPCSQCERSFTTQHNMKRHQLIHAKEEMYRCSVCGVLFCQEHELGNMSSIIKGLQQNDMDELVDPQSLDLETLPKSEPAGDSFQTLDFKEEQRAGKKKKKCKHRSHFSFDEGEDKPSFRSEVPQIHKSKEDFCDLVFRKGPKIQKIAYDIEVTI